MSNTTKGLLIALTIITLLLGLVVFSYQKQTPKNTYQPPTTLSTPTTPVPTSNPSATLSFSPDPLVLDTSSGSLDVMLNGEDYKITAAQLELLYDPKLITNVAITPGPFIQNPIVLIKKIDQAKGRITMALGIQPTDTGKVGKGIIARLTFNTSLQSGEKTAIQFLQTSLVTAEGASNSILKSTTGVTISKP